MDKDEKGRVADCFRIGRIETTIRRNETDAGRVWFNVTFSRKFFGQDGEKDAWSFGFEDLQNLAKAAEIAFCKVWELRDAESEPRAEEEAAQGSGKVRSWTGPFLPREGPVVPRMAGRFD